MHNAIKVIHGLEGQQTHTTSHSKVIATAIKVVEAYRDTLSEGSHPSAALGDSELEKVAPARSLCC